MRRADTGRALAALAARAAGSGTAGAATAATTSPVVVVLAERARGPPPPPSTLPSASASSRPLWTSAIAGPARRPTGSLLPALAAWRRALHAPSAAQQSRSMAAAAAAAAHPLPAAAATDDEDDEHARRLSELQQHAQQQQQQQAQQPRGRPRRQLDLSSVPMLDIKKGCASSAAKPAAPVRAAPPPLDWREVVRRARASSAESQAADPLTDLHGRAHDYLRISLTERCNLRCSYCMPEEGVALTPNGELLTPQEVQRLARLFVRAGVTKIRLTGGEPTVRRDLVDVVAALAELQGEGLRSIALTSNGVALERQLPRLCAAGLTHLNVSLDTLSPRRFERLTRRPADAHARVLGALDAALELGFGGTLGGGGAAASGGSGNGSSSAFPFSFGASSSGLAGPPPSYSSSSAAAPAGVKLNVVVVRGVNDDEVELFSALTRAAPLNVRFIEYMPFDGNAWGEGKGMVPYAELRGRADLYAARAAAEEQAAAMASAALPFPLPVASAWPRAGGGWGLPSAASSSSCSSSPSSSAAPTLRGGGVMAFAAAAYHRLAGGADAWEQQQQEKQQQEKQQQQQREQRRRPGPVARFAAEAGAALPLAPPPPSPASHPPPRAFAADAPLLALRRLDDHPSEVAKNFRAPGHAGTLSFVTSMTHHFCGGCTRLRLLADGALKVCLFGASEVSLRDAARGGATDEDLLAVVGAAVRRKRAAHAGMHAIAAASNRPMITIGG